MPICELPPPEMPCEAALFTYHAWNAAEARFAVSPAALSSDQRRTLDLAVAQSLTIEAAILASPEARDVRVSRTEATDAATGWLAEHPACPLGVADLAEPLRRELTVQRALARVAATASPVSDAEVSAFLHRDPDRFRTSAEEAPARTFDRIRAYLMGRRRRTTQAVWIRSLTVPEAVAAAA